jgi:hypothetical protein
MNSSSILDRVSVQKQALEPNQAPVQSALGSHPWDKGAGGAKPINNVPENVHVAL